MTSLVTDDLLSGVFDVTELQKPLSKVVRLYLCSAGTDTLRERDALVQFVYPRLRDYCRENYGLEFQVVDLKWGLTKAWDDHSDDRQLCLDELTRCQELSVGPSFMALLGQKYGERQLPVQIPANQFDNIMQALRHHRNRETRDAFKLEQWYVQDENCSPLMYVLQTEDEVRKRLRPQTAVEKAIYGERKDVKWEEAKPDLRRLLSKGLDYCLRDGTLDHFDVSKYLVSDLETELEAGLEIANGHPSRCHALIRNIVDLKNYVDHPTTGKFLELIYDEDENRFKVDPEAETRLQQLIENEIEKCLPADNVSHFSVLWKQDDGINVQLHKDYLEEVCQTFEEMIRVSVDRMAPQGSMDDAGNPEREIYQHWNVARLHYDSFVGRGELLDVIKAYVLSNDCKPLVLFGNSGVGKTALMAKSAVETNKWFKEPVITISRFLDCSSDTRMVLHGLCVQLTSLLGGNTGAVPTEYKQLHTHLVTMFSEFPDDRNLVIYLDAAQNLAAQKDVNNVSWLPASLKSNVKVVISIGSQSDSLLHELQTEVVNDENNFLEVTAMTDVECLSMLLTMLHAEGRTLSPNQQNHLISEVFAVCNVPLYAKLLLQQARQWTADLDVTEFHFPVNCAEYIQAIFTELGERHGPTLTSRAISYLTASATGLSDCEMEDVLSLDDDVLNEVLPGYSTPVRRLPPLAWLRLKTDLADFLCRADSEGITVYRWQHAEFVEVSRQMYLEGAQAKEIHGLLADYYLGVWATKKKPFVRPSSANNNQVTGEADRLVPRQPLTFEPSDTVTRYNRRKYNQVPLHLLLSGRLKELNDLVLFNYEWIYNKTKASTLDHVLADFALNPGVEVSLVEKALRDAQPFIAQNVNNMAAEVSGRLLPYYHSHPYIRKLIQECDTSGVEHCAFVPNFPYHDVPGSPLKFSIKTKGPITDMALMGESGRVALAKNREDPFIQMYDLVTGQHEVNVFSSVGNMYVSPDGKTTVIVDHITEKTLKVHDTESGTFLGQLIPLNQIQLKPKEKYKLSNVTVSNEHVCVIATTETSYLFIGDLASCTFIQALGLEGRSTICQITPDARYVFCNSNENLLAYDLNTLQNVTNTTLESRPKTVAFNSDTSRAYVINGTENRLFMLTLSDGGVDFLYKVVLQESFGDDIIVDVKLSNAEDMLLVRGEDNIVVYDVVGENVRCHFSRPDGIPVEFKLPSSYYTDIHFIGCSFSSDDKFVIATIFRNVYIWNVSTNRLLTYLQAPVGLIEYLFVPPERGQIVTQSSKSDIIQVWSIGDAIGHVGMLDRLTSPVDDVILTSDDRTAFAKCSNSDEIGIFEMKSGKLRDLLTHEGPVQQMTVTSDGNYVLVSLARAKEGLYNKIWHVTGRKIMYEFGNAPAISVSLEHENSVFSFCQEENAFKTPYSLSQYKLNGDNFDEYKLEYDITFLLCRPFVTPGDKYLVTLCSDLYDDRRAIHEKPTIYAMSLEAGMSVSSYDADYLKQSVKVTRILHIRPYPNNSYTIVCLYTNEPDPEEATAKPYHQCYSFMIFDICSGVVCQVLEDFVSPQVPLDGLLFTDDVSLCIDHESNVFDMGTGFFMKRLYDTETAPRCLALGGRVALYGEGVCIFAVRLSDQKCIGHVNVHGEVTKMVLGHDGRTVVIGCRDGSVTSYVIIDQCYERPEGVVAHVASRKLEESSLNSRLWDKVDVKSGPPYSRPPSAAVNGPKDREILKKVKPLTRPRSTADPLLYMSSRSKTCAIQ